MKLRLSFFSLLMLFSVVLLAQELKVESFSRLELDLLPRTSPRLDLNDVPCAVVRISVANAKEFTFKGNIIGDVVYAPGEAVVYMTDKSRMIRINSDQFGTLDYTFPEYLERQVCYGLKLKLMVDKDNKIRTLVMPVAGIGDVFSYGIMVGVVKRHGGYLKVKYNFQDTKSDFKCNDSGVIEGTSEQSWFTGDDKKSRFAVTAGYMYRIIKPVYIYAGAGYGFKKVSWEMTSSEWAENTDKTHTGVEAELGGVARFGNFAFSAGVQTNSFKYWEATVGVGIMF